MTIVCDNPDFAGSFANGEDARKFMLAGKATVSFLSLRTGTHFTFKISKAMRNDHGDGNMWFVSVLTGDNNENDFTYIGTINGYMDWHHGRRATIGNGAPSVRAFEWAWARLAVCTLPENMEIWHSGRCGKCKRKLTHPDSVKAGFGSECGGKV